MWSRPSAGAGPISRTSEAALRPRDTALKPPLPAPRGPKVRFSSLGWLTLWISGPRVRRAQLSLVPGAVVANSRSLRGFKQQTRSLAGCTPAVQVLQGCPPGGSRRLCRMLLPAAFLGLSDVSLGSLLPCAPATHPRVSVSPRFQNSQFRVSFHWHRRPGVLTHTHTLPQTSRAYAHLYIFVGLTVITDKSRRGQKLRQRQSHFQFMSIKNGHRLLAWETRWGVFLLSCD